MALYKNRQWIVSTTGINPDPSLPDYDIAIERVFETTRRGEDTYYDWPVHMATKTWVDARDFNDAFDHAIRHYSGVSGQPIDQAMLTASYAEALRIAARR